MRTFRLKGKEFYELAKGWYARELNNAFRIYYGPVPEWNTVPSIVNVYRDEDDLPVDLDSLEDAVEWMALKREEDVGQQTR